MPVYDFSARDTVAKLEAATEAEGIAIKAIHAALEARAGQEELMRLTQAMEDAHSAKMRIYQELQAFRLDKE